MLQSMKGLEGYEVRATDGDAGSVADFLLEDTSWTVRHLVVDTGGLLTRRKVLIPPSGFGEVNHAANCFGLTLSLANVASSPGADADEPVPQQTDGEPAANAHLRSVREIAGYRVEGTDGPVGHVRDLVVDDETWAIQYLVIATANWWPGKSVLTSPRHLVRVSWMDRKVHVAMTREAIKGSLALGPSLALERADNTVAVHEANPVRAADAAVIRDAREGRMP